MNAQAWITLATAAGGLLVQVGFAIAALAFVRKELDRHEARLDEHGGTLVEHGETLVEHGGKIERGEVDIARLIRRVFNGGR